MKYNVLPLDDRTVGRLNSDLAGRPQPIKGDSQLLFSGTGRLSEDSVLVMKNKSFSITAEVEVPANGAEGVILSQGGRIWWHDLIRQERKSEVCLQLLRFAHRHNRTGQAMTINAVTSLQGSA